MRKSIITGLGVIALASASILGSSAIAQEQSAAIQKGDIIATDFGRIVSASDLDRSLRERGGRVLSKIGTGSLNGKRTLILGPDQKKYFVKISVQTGKVIWIAPANPYLVARYKG